MNKALWGKQKPKFSLWFIVLLITVCLCGKLFFPKIGYSFFVVTSGSMESEYPVNSLIICRRVPFDSLEIGDVIVFRSNALGGREAFHRIVDISDGRVFTKGDNSVLPDNQPIGESEYVAKGIAKSYFLGRYLLTVKNPIGFLLFFVLPLLLVYFGAIYLKKLVFILID